MTSPNNTSPHRKTVTLSPPPRIELSGKETLQQLFPLLLESQRTYTEAKLIFDAPAFQATLNLAVDHLVNQNNITDFIDLLDKLRETNWYKPLLLWICERCGIRFQFRRSLVKNGLLTSRTSMKFTRPFHSAPRDVEIADFLTAENTGSLKKVLFEMNRNLPGSKKSNEWKVRVYGNYGG